MHLRGTRHLNGSSQDVGERRFYENGIANLGCKGAVDGFVVG